MAEDVSPPEHGLMMATVGSKNRVCLPPTLVDHLGIESGSKVVWITGLNKLGKPFAYMRGVKKENFTIEDAAINEIESTLK